MNNLRKTLVNQDQPQLTQNKESPVKSTLLFVLAAILASCGQPPVITTDFELSTIESRPEVALTSTESDGLPGHAPNLSSLSRGDVMASTQWGIFLPRGDVYVYSKILENNDTLIMSTNYDTNSCGIYRVGQDGLIQWTYRVEYESCSLQIFYVWESSNVLIVPIARSSEVGMLFGVRLDTGTEAWSRSYRKKFAFVPGPNAEVYYVNPENSTYRLDATTGNIGMVGIWPGGWFDYHFTGESPVNSATVYAYVSVQEEPENRSFGRLRAIKFSSAGPAVEWESPLIQGSLRHYQPTAAGIVAFLIVGRIQHLPDPEIATANRYLLDSDTGEIKWTYSFIANRDDVERESMIPKTTTDEKYFYVTSERHDRVEVASLVKRDLLTGELIWRSPIIRNSNLTDRDDEFIYLTHYLAPGQARIKVLRTSDGQLLGTLGDEVRAPFAKVEGMQSTQSDTYIESTGIAVRQDGGMELVTKITISHGR